MKSAFMAQGSMWRSNWSRPDAAFLGSVPLMAQTTTPTGEVMPIDKQKPVTDGDRRAMQRLPNGPQRTVQTVVDRGLDRICAMLENFAERSSVGAEEGEARSHIFWSYIRNQAKRTNQGEEAVVQTVQGRCPNFSIPAKPPARVDTKPPKEKGFHGKTTLSYAEAKELSELLTVVLTPLSPEEAAKEIAREECLRDMVRAEGFPIVERLQERLTTFLATAQPTDTFEISHGEVVVTGKAVECAEAIGRVKTIRTVAYTGGAAASGLGLLWLLGIL